MKKVLIALAIVIIGLGIAGFAWYKSAYGGVSYYTHIMMDGKKTQEKADSGEIFYRWYYTVKAADTDGDVKTVDFTADHNLKLDTYLDLTVNQAKGVTSWQEVQKSEVPSKALGQLDK